MECAWMSNIAHLWPEGHKVTFNLRSGLLRWQLAKLNSHVLREHASVLSKKIGGGAEDTGRSWSPWLCNSQLSRSSAEMGTTPLHEVEFRPLNSRCALPAVIYTCTASQCVGFSSKCSASWGLLSSHWTLNTMLLQKPPVPPCRLHTLMW